MSPRVHHPALSEEIARTSVLLVCGSGGVGKTSVAAAIAVEEALRGRRVCVLTVDPARRLAQAMGLTRLDDRERAVALPDRPAAGGTLTALMLDPKRAFDRLVEETAPDEEQRERILGNRIYRNLSENAAGVQEYMALERLFELDRSDRYDLLVVDTPPAAHARDLLEGPERMLTFLQGRSLRWFLRPGARMGRFGLKAVGGSGGPIVSLLQRVTGAELLRDTTEFFENMEGMYELFADRLAVVQRLFSDERTGFLVVTSPERESVDQAVAFEQLLAARDYRSIGTVVNRVEPALAGGTASTKALRDLPGVEPALAGRLREAQQDHYELAQRDAARVAELSETAGTLTVSIPRLSHVVSDIAGLRDLSAHLYVSSETPSD